MKRTACALASTLASAICASAHADEGMWTFDNFPKAMVKERYGVDITDAWLDRVRLATGRISGCTGSFISPDGLMLTNNHCTWSCIGQLSSKEHDYFADGFFAAKREDERQCKTQTISVLMRMEEVTPRIAQATAGLDDRAANEARKKELTLLEQACEENSKKKGSKTGPLACEGVSLYDGGQHFIYAYKRYVDVRLVMAPEHDIAVFGGDPDNFQYPRWTLDFSLLRAYENGKPARTPHHLRIDFDGPKEGEVSFMAGHPGTTDRLLTVEQLETLRNTYMPFWLIRNSELRGRYIQFARQDAESQRIAQDSLDLLENGIKVYRKQLDALLDDRLMDRKRAEEAELRKAVAGDPALQAIAGNAWDDMAKAQAAAREQLQTYTFVEQGAGLLGSLYQHAVSLVRGTAEREKPNGERLREYTEAALPRLVQSLKADTPIYPSFEKLKLTFSMERLREWLGPDAQIVQTVLGKDSPASRAAALVDGTKLGDAKVRVQLWEGGAAAVAASNDPMIVLARTVDPISRGIRKRYEDEVLAPTRAAAERIANVRFKVIGTNTYPDATFTLRLNVGTIKGWIENGSPVVPFTQLDRFYARATGQEPFRAPDSWQKAKPDLDLATRFDQSSDHDSIGGNSGSPLVNAKGEIVGLIFDGNIHSLSGAYWFDTGKNRSVSVNPQIIRLALTKVYKADALWKEINAR